MAKRTKYLLEDDFDGSPADETVPFELDGTAYTIDLSSAHAEAFRAALTPFIQAANLAAQRQARRSEPSRSARPARGTGGPTAAQRRADNTAIREWARGAGYQISDRGRLKNTIVEKYHQATTGLSPSSQR